MGESKRREALRERVLAGSPPCIYCAGRNVGATLEHFPPRVLFALKLRPPGLEFAACEACNRGSRLDDQVAGLMARAFPNPRTAAEDAELAKLMRGVGNNAKGLLAELYLGRDALERSEALPLVDGQRVRPVNWSGPIFTRHMQRFAAKAAFALHFEGSGAIVPPGGAVCVWLLSNVDALMGRLPVHLLSLLGEAKTLRQGRWSVQDQFTYDSTFSDSRQLSGHYMTVRKSFAVCAFVAAEGSIIRSMKIPQRAAIFEPGWLQS